MKRILLLAALLGVATTGAPAFAYDFVSRAIPATEDAMASQNGATVPMNGAVPGAVPVDGAYEVGDFAAEEEEFKLISGSIVGTWQDGFMHEGNTWNVDQVWLQSAKEVDTGYGQGLNFGYGIDAVFGTNFFQSSDGFDGKWGVSGDGYGASMVQAYGEVGYGILSLKVGKFGTTIGAESLNTTEMDFVTHSNMYDHEPSTHTGGLFTLHLAETFSLDIGLTSGLDNSFANRRGDSGFLFGASWDLAENVSVSYASQLSQIHSAPDEFRLGTAYGYYDLGGSQIGDSDEYLQTITTSIDFTDRFSYCLGTNYGTMSDRATHTARYGQLGFANYFTYMLTDKLKAGVRYEYYTQWLDKAAEKLGEYEEAEQHCHALSFALNYQPTEFMFIRPEARYDWIETGDFSNKYTEQENGFTGSVACGFTF